MGTNIEKIYPSKRKIKKQSFFKNYLRHEDSVNSIAIADNGIIASGG